MKSVVCPKRTGISVHTSIPHSRTWLATFLASGQSSGVPTALQSNQPYILHIDECGSQETHNSQLVSNSGSCRSGKAHLCSRIPPMRYSSSPMFSKQLHSGQAVFDVRSPISPKAIVSVASLCCVVGHKDHRLHGDASWRRVVVLRSELREPAVK